MTCCLVLVCGAVCCAVLCPWVRCCAALLRIAPPRVVLFCAVLCYFARLVPLLAVLCFQALCFFAFPARCVLRAVSPLPWCVGACCCSPLCFVLCVCAVCVLGSCAARSLSSLLCAVLYRVALVRLLCAVRVVCAVWGAWCCGALLCVVPCPVVLCGAVLGVAHIRQLGAGVVRLGRRACKSKDVTHGVYDPISGLCGARQFYIRHSNSSHQFCGLSNPSIGVCQVLGGECNGIELQRMRSRTL